MLNEYLSVVSEQEKKASDQRAFIDLLSQLPFEELDQIHQTGEIKLAFFDSCVTPSAGGPKSWLECFKGSPFMEQAIALEQEELQAQMAQQQAMQVERQKNQMSWDQMDQIRLKKRLLELQKAKAESQTLQQAGVVTSQALQPDAQGAGAAPTAPEGPDTQMASKVGMDMNLMSSLKGVAGAGPKLQGQITNVGQKFTGSAAGQVKSMARKGTLLQGAPPPRQMIQPLAVEKDPFAKAASARFKMAESWGRELARADMEKAASVAYVNQVGQRAGELLAKTALAISPEVMTGIANFAKKNKGALIGAGVGAAGEAAHMAMDDEHHGLVGGAGRILGAGALGGAAGHAAEHIGNAVQGGQTLGAATKSYGGEIKKKFMSLSDKVRGASPPPPVEAMP